jgi:hypothetical protein
VTSENTGNFRRFTPPAETFGTTPNPVEATMKRFALVGMLGLLWTPADAKAG